MEDPLTQVFRIVPTVQNYDWGKVGLTSKVAQLASGDTPHFVLKESTPYAELWMGTHPTSPSRIRSSTSDIHLSAHLAAHPHLLGTHVIERFSAASDGNLPFLFKVLSIEKALSIQSHPDKNTAEQLHALQPHIYKDANHKPEMAVALTPFRALCGFLPLPKIASYLRSTPEFTALIPGPIAAQFLSVSCALPSPSSKTVLKSLFSALMTTDPPTVQKQLDALISRYQSGGADGEEKDVADLVLQLNTQFPGDIGVFCAFMLNYVHLNPGEAIFLGAGEPHAYVSGDIMECMANSDNVIRAGLTPKLRDIPNLVAGLTYSSGPASQHAVQPAPFSSRSTAADLFEFGVTSTLLYQPPVSEFSVLRTIVQRGDTETHRAIDGPSIAIVIEGRGFVRWGNGSGNGLNIVLGHVIFIGAGTEISFGAADTEGSSDRPLVVYRAFVEVV